MTRALSRTVTLTDKGRAYLAALAAGDIADAPDPTPDEKHAQRIARRNEYHRQYYHAHYGKRAQRRTKQYDAPAVLAALDNAAVALLAAPQQAQERAL